VIRFVALIGVLVLVATRPVRCQGKVSKDGNSAKSAVTASASGAANAKPGSTPKTPLGIYQKQVTDQIGARWYSCLKSQMDSISVGKVTITFRILASGRVTKLRVISNTSNDTLAALSVRAILESRFPPIPEAVRRQTHEDFMDWDGVSFMIYPN
jgi:hypothetical protein